MILNGPRWKINYGRVESHESIEYVYELIEECWEVPYHHLEENYVKNISRKQYEQIEKEDK